VARRRLNVYAAGAAGVFTREATTPGDAAPRRRSPWDAPRTRSAATPSHKASQANHFAMTIPGKSVMHPN